jgi:RNA polymerase sigma factor (sigma-70 family)
MKNTEPLRKNTRDEDINNLIKDCQNGKHEAFKDLYHLLKEKMYNIAFRLHGNEDDAADSLQESFIKVYKNISGFRFESSFSTWFYRILMNTCLDNLKKKYNERRANLTDYDNVLSINPTSNFENEAIEHEIYNLPPAYKAVFILYEIEGFSHQEISGILRVSIGTSKSNLHRAKEILKSKLRKYFEEIHE